MKAAVPLIVLICAGAVLGIWWRRDSNQPVYRFSGTIEADDAAVGSKAGGRIAAVDVAEGDEVVAGQALVRLDQELLAPQRDEAAAAFEEARQALLELQRGSRPEEIERARANYAGTREQWRLLTNGPRREDIDAARANAEAAEAALNLAVLTEKRQRGLFEKGDAPRDHWDRARTELEVAQSRLRAAEAELEQLMAGFREEEIGAAAARMRAASAELALAVEGPRAEAVQRAAARLARASAALEHAKTLLAETVIRAPTNAVVETCRIEPGDLLPAYQTALTLILDEPLWVRIYVPESLLGHAPVGRKAPVSVQSFPGREFEGEIVQVNRRAEFTPRNVQTPETRDDLVFGVKIRIGDPGGLLRPGMVADVGLTPLGTE